MMNNEKNIYIQDCNEDAKLQLVKDKKQNGEGIQ